MDVDRWRHDIHDIHEFRDNCPPDEAIARVASRCGGVVDRAQVAALGLTRGAIGHRIRVGRLRPIHHGVYAVGHEAIQVRGRFVAALLSAGPGAGLSHRTAAALWKITRSLPPFLDVTIARGNRRSRPGVVLHRATTLDAALVHGLPTTTPIRTLLDLATSLPTAELERACSEALVQRLVPPSSSRSRAAAERPWLPASRATESPRPARSSRAVSSRRSCERGCPDRRSTRGSTATRWTSSGHEQRLVVELDGWRFHGHRLAFERDRVRDAELQLRGYTVVRFTWRRLHDEPAAMAGQIASFLSRPATRRAS